MNHIPLRLHLEIGPRLSRVPCTGRGGGGITAARSSFGTIGNSAGVWMEISPWITETMVAKDSLASYVPPRFRNIAPKRRAGEGQQNEKLSPLGDRRYFDPDTEFVLGYMRS